MTHAVENISERYGTFKVSLNAISWTQRTSYSESNDDHIQQRTIWVLIEVLQGNGQAIESIWFLNDDVNAMTKCVDMSADQHDTDDSTRQLDYSQSSRPIPLTKESLTQLASASLRITVYNEINRLRTADACWGEQRIALLPAIIGECLHERVRIVGSVDQREEITIDTSIQCDADLADFTLGARVLRLQSFAIASPPPEWTFTCETNEDAIQACASDKNSASYELELFLPEFDSEKNCNISFEKVKFSGGKLSFQPHNTVFPTEVGETLNGTWSITFSSVMNKLYVQSTVPRLLDFIQVEKKINAQLRRSSVDLAGRVTTSVQIRLDSLATAGTCHLHANAKLKTIAPFPKESLEQELAAATANDEKKRLQGLIADYENTFVLPTKSLTSSIFKSKTALEGTILIVNTPLIPEPPPTPLPSKTIDQLIPPRDLNEEYDQKKDILKDLRTEIRRVVLVLLKEYEDIDATSETNSQDDKRRQIVFKLNTQGTYHSFKEKLKKRIVPVIREQFSSLEGDSTSNETDNTTDQVRANARKKEYFAQLYAKLMEEVHSILHETFYSNSTTLEETYIDQQPRDVKKITDTLALFALKAMESEVNRDTKKAETIHLDRIAYAEARASEYPALAVMISPSLVDIWLDYAKFCIRRQEFNKAGGALRQCLSLSASSLPVLLVYGGLLCELRDFTTVEDVLKSAVCTAMATQDVTSVWKELVIAHAMLALYFRQCGRDQTGNLTLFELLRAKKVLSAHRNGGEGETNLSSVWINLAEMAHEIGLQNVTQYSLDLANEFHKQRDVLTVDERVIQRTIQSKLYYMYGKMDEGSLLLHEALDLDPTHSAAWFVLGEAHLEQQGAHGAKNAIECLTRALEHKNRLRFELQLKLFVYLGLTLLQAAQYSRAKDVFLLACEEIPTSSSWLGVGIASIRLEQWDSARAALTEANRHDHSNAEVWGYLALLALNEPSQLTNEREQKAKQFVAQAVRHELNNPNLLRELSNGFVAIDRLEDAEAMLRRSLVYQDSPLTRKKLADVLAAQNCAQDALSQYKQSLDASNHDVSARCELLEMCAVQLTTLGRQAEADEYRQMAKQFLVTESYDSELLPSKQSDLQPVEQVNTI